MIDREHGLSLSRQAEALGISRGAVYYRPQVTSAGDLALMRRTCELHLDHPFAGSRMLKGLLRAEGHEVGRLRVSTLMRRMGIEAIHRRLSSDIRIWSGALPHMESDRRLPSG